MSSKNVIQLNLTLSRCSARYVPESGEANSQEGSVLRQEQEPSQYTYVKAIDYSLTLVMRTENSVQACTHMHTPSQIELCRCVRAANTGDRHIQACPHYSDKSK